MVRQTRFRRLLSPLLKRNPDTCIAGRFLVLRPVGHVFCSVLFDTVGIAGAFRPRTLIFPTFALPPALELRDIPDVWQTYRGEAVFSLPLPELAEQISRDIEAAVLPQFRSLVDFNTLHDFLMEGHLQIWTRGALHFRLELAMGNFDAARMLMRWHRRRWFADEAASGDASDFAHERRLCELLDANDHKAIARLLREIEEDVAVAYEVDDLWEPSPFPFEDGYDDWLRQEISAWQ